MPQMLGRRMQGLFGLHVLTTWHPVRLQVPSHAVMRSHVVRELGSMLASTGGGR